MASDDDRIHAARLLKIHKRNLERLEEKKAKLGSGTDLSTENAIDEERANIAALEPIANPPPTPSPKIQEFVKQATPGEVDLIMLFMQGTQINARMTKAEEQNQSIIAEQSRASVWRMQLTEIVDTLLAQTAGSELARRAGAKWYRRAIVMALSVAILALIVGCAALVAVTR